MSNSTRRTLRASVAECQRSRTSTHRIQYSRTAVRVQLLQLTTGSSQEGGRPAGRLAARGSVGPRRVAMSSLNDTRRTVQGAPIRNWRRRPFPGAFYSGLPPQLHSRLQNKDGSTFDGLRIRRRRGSNGEEGSLRDTWRSSALSAAALGISSLSIGGGGCWQPGDITEVWLERSPDECFGFLHSLCSDCTILAVITGSPAAAAGLRAGDKIVSIDGVDVGSKMELGQLLGVNSPHLLRAVRFGVQPRRFSTICLLGGPCSGKTTVCNRVAAHLGLLRISIGEMLAEMVKRRGTDDPLSLEIQAASGEGCSLREDLLTRIVHAKLHSLGEKYNGIVWDGFPRTQQQATLLQQWTGQSPSAVVFLDCPTQTMLERVQTRAADADVMVQEFPQQSAPVCEFYEGKGLLRVVKTSGSDIDQVTNQVMHQLQTLIQHE